LAIIMASRWKRPSATNSSASVPAATRGAVQPSTSPARGAGRRAAVRAACRGGAPRARAGKAEERHGGRQIRWGASRMPGGQKCCHSGNCRRNVQRHALRRVCSSIAENELTQKFKANCGSLRAAAQAVHTLYGWSRQPCHDLHPNVAQWRVPGHRGPMLRLPASTAARAHGVLSTHAQCCGSAATGSSGPARRCPTRHGPC